MLISVPRVQVIPVYRVRLALAFTVGNLQIKPLCGWGPGTFNHRFAFSRGVQMTLKPRLACSGVLGVTGGQPCTSDLLNDGYDSEFGPLDAPLHIASGSHRVFEGVYYEVESATEMSLDRGGY